MNSTYCMCAISFMYNITIKYTIYVPLVVDSEALSQHQYLSQMPSLETATSAKQDAITKNEKFCDYLNLSQH